MTTRPAIKISPAEGVVMEALWQDSPQGSEELGARLGPANSWGEETVRTLLRRLLAKGAVTKAPQGRRVLYTPVLRREDYVSAEGRGLIDRLFGGSLANLVHHFGATERLKPEELEALNRLVRKIEDGDA
ncbi:MAG: BlaI/MecI/CopY family transcriptional regulator [Caulobacteraceae bacterium]|nr:BlaI/MecI/CopY family transcriptional regulator [Caulobacteraceae bacterium]